MSLPDCDSRTIRQAVENIVAGLVYVVGAETVADYCCVYAIKLIGRGEVYVSLDIVIRHIPPSFDHHGGIG